MNEISDFGIISDEEFERGFLNIISYSSKDNTYKFALAKFLLEYSNSNINTHVDFFTIAKYLLK